MSKIRYSASTERLLSTQELCSCVPPDPSVLVQDKADRTEVIPLASALNEMLQISLASHFPRSQSFSLLLLHVTQFEYVQISARLPGMQKRIYRHAPASFLAQVIHPIRRTLRASDQVLVDEGGSGAALLFPQVDQLGVARIIERVSHSINLLQAETVVPPLRQQTEIVIGAGSYPESAASVKELLIQASRVQERVVFRPAVLPENVPHRARTTHTDGAVRSSLPAEEGSNGVQPQGIPFMQIPSRLPTRLKQLVPCSVARQLRCAPVGRDHNRLTVAMANPTDERAIDHLREVTGMTIFPVSCELSALETLLASNW